MGKNKTLAGHALILHAFQVVSRTHALNILFGHADGVVIVGNSIRLASEVESGDALG
jgi:hypothetical protein